MAEIINIKNEAGEVQYPVTKPECVIDENGKNVLQLIRENAGGESYDDTEIRNELTELSEEVGKKQDTITDLETIRSGAEKGATAIQEVKTINGQSIVGSGNIEIQGGGGSGMTTPSGDPMHYMFEAAGATYNATDADIPMVGEYGDSYVHKARHWHLNELGDITNEEMREIYSNRYPFKGNLTLNNLFTNTTSRTIICNAAVGASGHTENYFLYDSRNIETLFYEGAYGYVILTSLIGWIYNCKKLKKVINVISLQYVTSSGALGSAFLNCASLEYVRLFKLSHSISFKDSPLLSEPSILYMIENEVSTSAIVITLHADAYARAMADTEITAALAAHPNVSLASA